MNSMRDMSTGSDNNTQPLVSVIIPVYNRAAYIEETIHSVIQQSYKNVELLVVDDGSTDDSANRIEVLRKKHGFMFKKQNNMGQSHALNNAIKHTHGDLIAPFDSDDIMLPERLEKQVAYMQDRPEVAICCGNVRHMDSQSNIIQEKRPRHTIPSARYDFNDIFLRDKPFPPTTTMLIRRNALEKVGGFDPDIGALHDWLLYLKVTHEGYFIDRMDEVLAHYRVHDSNLSSNYHFMLEGGLATIGLFKEHPCYDFVRTKIISSMFLKMANRDKAFARELLAMIPFRNWNRKVWRGLARLYFQILKN
jgi:alpha-1,3-rhamnosyltransferase